MLPNAAKPYLDQESYKPVYELFPPGEFKQHSFDDVKAKITTRYKLEGKHRRTIVGVWRES
ncbi:hypothetical protein Ciccas_014384 [Cichlidogyrus casuarinus]|uniref:Uncharacterized protein n=1 Tax=Cichlidogyrus casuarinus TaxID=1844966 RepID=A0ABD2PIE4_9PLAT